MRCGGRGCAFDEWRVRRTAKSCGPDTPTLVSSRAGFIRAAMVAKEPGHQGERAISRKTIAQGRPDVSAEPVCSCAFLHLFCTRDRGCSAHPVFPAPSDFKARKFIQNPGAWRRGNEKSCPSSSSVDNRQPVCSLPPCGGELERGVSRKRRRLLLTLALPRKGGGNGESAARCAKKKKR